MNINKTIHESMGLCWHEIALVDEGDICEHCGEELEFDGYFHTNPDYTDPVHYCALMDWMREDGRNWKLRSWVKKDSGCCDMDDWMDLDTIGQITLIAEAIEAGVLK